MNRTDRRSSKRHKGIALHRCTDTDYILIDFSQEIRKFTNTVDGQVEDLSYDIVGILQAYSPYLYSDDPVERDNLAEKFYRSRYVKNTDDMDIIVDAVVDQLYPDLTEVIRSHNYRIGKVQQIKLEFTKATRMPHCLIIVKVF